jgi:hypothetical protein
MLLLGLALAGPVEDATYLHLAGRSADAAALLVTHVDSDDRAALALGRVWFANQQWRLAEAAYHRVPRSSPLFLRSRIEATWAVFYAEEDPWRAVLRAVLLYQLDPTDRELRYLIGILGLMVSELRVLDMVRELMEDVRADPSVDSTRYEILYFEHVPQTWEYAPRTWPADGYAPELLRAAQLVFAGQRLGQLESRGRHRREDRQALRWLRAERREIGD